MIWELISYETVNQIIIPSKDLIIYFTKEFYIYIFWISVQHFVPQIYAYYCSTTLYNTLFASSSNFCRGMRWLMLNSGDSMVAMWCILGLWFLKKIPSVLTSTPIK